MNPVFCCGFECGLIGSDNLSAPHWYLATGSVGASVSTTTVRSGSRSLRSHLSGNTEAGYVTVCPTLGSSSYVVMRAYIYFASLPTVDMAIMSSLSNSSNNPGIFFKAADGKLYPGNQTSGGTITFGSTGFVAPTGQWLLLDLLVDSSADPWTVDAQVDHNSLTQFTLAAAAGNLVFPTVGRLYPGAAATVDIFFDDVLISLTKTDYPIGEGYINHFVPTSDGSHNVAGAADFKRGAAGVDITNSTTDSYLLVDDIPMDDTTPDANDYINAIAPANATDYTENRFGPASGVGTPSAGPRAAEVITANHQFGTGNGVSATKLNDNGSEDSVMSLSGAGVTTIRYYRKHYATMVGGGAWTLARFNNLRVRFGYSSDANPDQYFDCAMIEAEFSPPPVASSQKAILQAVRRASVF